MAMGHSRRWNAVFDSIAKLLIYVVTLVIVAIVYIKYNSYDGSDGSSSQDIQSIQSISGGKYLISYVMYAPNTSSKKSKRVYDVCRENVDVFISRAVVPSDNVEYAFILPGESLQTSKMQHASLMNNVRVLKVKNDGVDILSHLKLLKTLDSTFDYYVLLNCGSRGPYYFNDRDKSLPSLSWLLPFTSKLKDETALVGPTISLEISPHVQTYAMAFSKNSSQIITDYWSQFINAQYSNNKGYDSEDRMNWITKLEVGLSEHILKSGLNIASLDARYDSIDFRKFNHSSKGPHIKTINPTRCEASSPNSIGCQGLEPCEVMFVKYGGEIMQSNAVAFSTKQRIKEEDKTAPMCNSFIGNIYRPIWDSKGLLKNMTIFNTIHHVGGDVDLVLLVRVYSQFSNHLLSMLFSLEASTPNLKVQVLLIPTDNESVDSIKQVIVNQWYIDSVHRRISVSLVQFPPWIYKHYGSYIETLCTDSWKNKALRLYHAGFIGRFCNVNSPLHYLLVDIVLEYVKAKMKPSPYWIVITNADNYYFPNFFGHLKEWKDSKIDVLMVNMIHNGILFPTSFKKSSTDLGAYAVKSNFLIKTNVSFLSSLPVRSNAINYHEADGHFLENVLSLNAMTHKIDDYNFAHN